MYCVSCGEELEDGARFCTHCGAQVDQQGQESQPTQPIQSDAPTQPLASPSRPKKPLSRNVKIGIGVGIGVAALVIIIALVVAFGGFLQQPEPADDSGQTRTTVIDKTQDSNDTEESTSPSDKSSKATDSNEKSHSDATNSSAKNKSSDSGSVTYADDRYGFSFKYPSSCEVTYDASEGGITLTDKETGLILIDVWGMDNTEGYTAKGQLKDFQESVGIEGYSASGDSWFVYSYEYDDTVVYMKQYVGKGSMVCMTITYPESLSLKGDALVEAIESTLEPGDLSKSYCK